MTASGSPAPALSESGTLPAGVTFLDNGDGTAHARRDTRRWQRRELPDHDHGQQRRSAARPRRSRSRSTARPAITSANATSFTVGQPASFTVTTERLSGTVALRVRAAARRRDASPTTAMAPRRSPARPRQASVGTFPLSVTAANSSGSVTQSFTLTVISGNARDHQRGIHDVTAGVARSFTVTATGTPDPDDHPPGSAARGHHVQRRSRRHSDPVRNPGDLRPRPLTINLIATSSTGKTSQAFTITINQPPSDHQRAQRDRNRRHPVQLRRDDPRLPRCDGFRDRSLPAGVNFKDNGNGTATIGGHRAAGHVEPDAHRRPTAVGIATQASRSPSSPPPRAHRRGPGVHEPSTGDRDRLARHSPSRSPPRLASATNADPLRRAAERPHLHQQWQRDRDDRRHPNQRRPVHASP